LALCENYQVLYDKLRRAGKAIENRKRDAQWKTMPVVHLRSLRAAKHGVRRTRDPFTLIDLIAIRLIDGDLGLENCWGRLSDCIVRIADLPARSTYQYLFTDEMCKSKMINMRVRDYDEMEYNRTNETCEYLEQKGRSCFEHAPT
jgi:hypothetical protein